MKRSCAHRWNARGRSWTGPSRAFTSAPAPRRTRLTASAHSLASGDLAAKKRKRRKTDSSRGVSPLRQSRDGSATLGSFHFAPHAKRLSIICSLVAPSGGHFRVPAALRQDFINQGYDASQSRINETPESSQIEPKNIVLPIRLKIERLASPAGTKAFLSEARLVATPRPKSGVAPDLRPPSLFGRAFFDRGKQNRRA